MAVVVPYDFSEVADHAVKYALNAAKASEMKVFLLHVVKKDSEKKDAESKLEKAAAGFPGATEGVIRSKVVVGSIFEDIAKIAETLDAKLIVMGTHGEKGLQRILGSHAIKVITSGVIPFCVVQEDTRIGDINRIVVPFDLSKESIQILTFASRLSKIYNAEVNLVGGEQTDEFLIRKSHSNIRLATSHLEKEGVPHKVELLPRQKRFAEAVLDYAETNNADLIAVGYMQNSIIPQLDRFVQTLITNEKRLPVLVVNAEGLYKSSSQYGFLTV